MKLWIDDLREAPEEYVWLKSVNMAKQVINYLETMAKVYKSYLEADLPLRIRELTEKDLEDVTLTLISIDHDAGDYACDGGDYIRLLDWLEETGRSYPIHIHSQNPVGVENMRRIIERNGWREVK